ncbi:MAG: OmpW family protein [Alphaproteobacteria bacterium]|nr:OmpW family protein [Alphaproteobacteria bacterium]
MYKNYKPLLLAVLLLAGSAGVARADDYQGFQAGDFLVHLRGVGVIPEVSSTITPIGGHVTATNSVIPEADLSYFFTPHIAAEVIAGVTTQHIVANDTSAHNVNLGHASLLPPTVTAQYHFTPASPLDVYAGAGLNYTFFWASDTGPYHVHYNNAVGEALQVGFNYHLTGNWYANMDVKQLFLNTDVHINGDSIRANVDLDPTLVGLGIGYRF